MKLYQPKRNKGLTLIELLIAMVISAILIAAIYRTFIRQQKSYTIQEQVVDMQQNARAAINRMMREIRMAGFGNVSNVLPFTALGGKEFDYIINPVDNQNNIEGQGDDQITIIGAFEQVSTLAEEHVQGSNTIQLLDKGSEFDTEYGRYICIGGLESFTVIDVSGNTITLGGCPVNKFPGGTPVFKLKAITYKLRPDHKNPNMPVLTREDNTDGGGSQVVAEDIENLQFEYFNDDGNLTSNPEDIRIVKVIVNARTSMADPEFKEGIGGFRRRTITSNIHVRNMGVTP